MTERLPLRDSPEYIEAVIGVKPQVHDDRDIRIRDLIRKTFLTEEWAIETFDRIHDQQIDYIRSLVHFLGARTLSESGARALTRTYTQAAVRAIGEELRSTIEEGEEHLAGLRGMSVLATTNHLGTYKLSHINPQKDLGDKVPKYEGYNFMYPFPLYFAALSPIADALGNHLSYSSIDYPGIFGEIHTEAGFIHIPPPSQVENGRRTELLRQQTAALLEEQPNTLIVNFPEGGTGGKYTENGPYDLRAFRTGSYVIAAQLGVPILPVAQYFDPKAGMRLKVFEPFYPSNGTAEDFQQMAVENRANIQAWLTDKEQA